MDGHSFYWVLLQIPILFSFARVLFYSFFNGVYKHNGTFHDGRPVYWEQRKSDDGDFKTKVPAKIKYCISEGAWVFTHDNIKKSEASREVRHRLYLYLFS